MGLLNNNINGSATSICVQNVIAGTTTVPTAMTNDVTTATAVPNIPNIIYGGGSPINQMTQNPVSTGSVPNGGIITAGICVQSQNIGCSLKVNMGGAMATTTGNPTGHDLNTNSYSCYTGACSPGKADIT